VRVSFAVDTKRLEEGISRIKEGADNIRQGKK
jgi:hypothetical protein